jgi:hypothetical protein
MTLPLNKHCEGYWLFLPLQISHKTNIASDAMAFLDRLLL